jgi:nucleoside-diphosphate-sugar epimerase
LNAWCRSFNIGAQVYTDIKAIKSQGARGVSEGPTCVITGGSGFIGSHLVERICTENLFGRILILDLVPPALDELSADRVTYHKVDIRQPLSLQLDEPVDVCFHLAALAKEPGYQPQEYYDTNVKGTENVLSFCEKNNINTLIFTSTEMVYNACDHRFFEDDPTEPHTEYGRTKLIAEGVINDWGEKSESRRCVTVRISVVFGNRENGNYTRLYNAIKGKYFFFVGRKNTIKSSIYVKDAVRGIIHAYTTLRKYRTYNLTITRELSLGEIVSTIKEVFDFRFPTLIVPYSIIFMASMVFEFASKIGLKTDINRRRIQKLYFSTNIAGDRISEEGFSCEYTLEKGIRDWKEACDGRGLF